MNRLLPPLLATLAALAGGCDRSDPADPAAPAANDETRSSGPVVLEFRAVSPDGAPVADPTARVAQPPDRLYGVPMLATDGVFRCGITPPFDALIEITAPGFGSKRVLPAAGRVVDGRVDLGDIVMLPGKDVRFVVSREDGVFVVGAEIHAVPKGVTFPPTDPAATHARQFTPDHRSRLGISDAGGLVRVRLDDDVAGLLILPPYLLAPAFVVPEDGAWPKSVVLGPGVRIDLRAETLEGAPFDPEQARADVYVDLGGVKIPTKIPFGREEPFLLDRARDVIVSAEHRGCTGTEVPVEAGFDEPVLLLLEPLDLRWVQIEAVDAEDGAPLEITSLQAGRARGDEPDRIDFVPDWAIVGVRGQGNPVLAGPTGAHDVLVAAAGHVETLARGVAFDGTREAPGTARIELARVPMVSGTVVDANGKPIENAIVQIRKTSRDLDEVPRLWRIGGTVGLAATLRTDPTGRFRFDTIARENLTFDVEAPGHAPLRVANVPRAETGDMTLRVGQKGHAVSGTVTGMLEAPPFATTVFLMDEAGPRVFRAAVGKDGAFSFRAIPPGTFRVYVDRDDRALFSGLLGDQAHAVGERLHAPGRGAEIEVTGDVNGLALESKDPTPFPGFRE